MKIDEAIKVLEVTERDPSLKYKTASREAIKLGIEALKTVEEAGFPLEGETL